ncbi:MAG: hypothetical protein ACK46M_17695 [Planctomyces sp.]|jgi:hypothetical protein
MGRRQETGFITKLIDDSKMTYEQVARKIGSTLPAVRRHYAAYQLLLHIENVLDDFPVEKAEHRLPALYNTRQKPGTQRYLGVDSNADPTVATNLARRVDTSSLLPLVDGCTGLNRHPH